MVTFVTALREACATAFRRSPRRPALLLSLALLGLVVGLSGNSPKTGAAALQTGDCSPASSWPADNGGLDSQVMSLINQHRASLGLGQLATSSALTASAVWKARQMAAYGVGAFSHNDIAPPVSRTVWDRISTCGYPYSAGENIAEGYQDAASVVNAWLQSTGHKQNIENPSYVVTGIGAAKAANGAVFWVQDFGLVADGGSPPPPTTTAPPPPTTTAGTTTTTTPAPTTTRTTTTVQTATTTTTTKTTTTTSPAVTETRPAGNLDLTPIKIAPSGSRRLVITTRPLSAGKAVISASVKCSAALGQRRLRVVVNAFRSGRARCAWRLPRRFHAGSFASGWVRVRTGSTRAIQAFAVRLP